jgi:hypothetical protein
MLGEIMKFILIILYFFLLVSCKTETQKENPNGIENETTEIPRFPNLEIEVVKSILESYNHSTKPPIPLLPLHKEYDKEYEIRMNLYFDSIHEIWNQTVFEFFIYDSLSNIKYSSIVNYLDSSFKIDSLSEVFNSQKFTFNVNDIKSDKIKIVNDSFKSYEDLDTIWNRYQFNGTFAFSKMIFNSDKNQVVLHYSYHCGKHCGGGYIIKLKKVNNSWEKLQAELISVE